MGRAAGIIIPVAVRTLLTHVHADTKDLGRVPLTMLLPLNLTLYATAALTIWNVAFATAFWLLLMTIYALLSASAYMFARLLFRPI